MVSRTLKGGVIGRNRSEVTQRTQHPGHIT